MFNFRARKVTSWNIKSFLKHKNSFFWEKYKKIFWRFHFVKHKKFSQHGFSFIFRAWVEWKVKGSIFGNIRKAFFWENIRNFFRASYFKEKFEGWGWKVQGFIFFSIKMNYTLNRKYIKYSSLFDIYLTK